MDDAYTGRNIYQVLSLGPDGQPLKDCEAYEGGRPPDEWVRRHINHLKAMLQTRTTANDTTAESEKAASRKEEVRRVEEYLFNSHGGLEWSRWLALLQVPYEPADDPCCPLANYQPASRQWSIKTRQIFHDLSIARLKSDAKRCVSHLEYFDLGSVLSWILVYRFRRFNGEPGKRKLESFVGGDFIAAWESLVGNDKDTASPTKNELGQAVDLANKHLKEKKVPSRLGLDEHGQPRTFSASSKDSFTTDRARHHEMSSGCAPHGSFVEGADGFPSENGVQSGASKHARHPPTSRATVEIGSVSQSFDDNTLPRGLQTKDLQPLTEGLGPGGRHARRHAVQGEERTGAKRRQSSKRAIVLSDDDDEEETSSKRRRPLFAPNSESLARVRAPGRWLDDASIDDAMTIFRVAAESPVACISSQDSNVSEVLRTVKGRAFLPVHENGNHWSLVVIPEDRSGALVYNSSWSWDSPLDESDVGRRINNLYDRRLDLSSISFTSPIQQLDASSCGLILIVTALYEILGEPVPQGQIHIGIWRQAIALMLDPINAKEQKAMDSLNWDEVVGIDPEPSFPAAEEGLHRPVIDLLRNREEVETELRKNLHPTGRSITCGGIFTSLQHQAHTKYKRHERGTSALPSSDLGHLLEAAARINRVTRFLEARDNAAKLSEELLRLLSAFA